MQPLRVFTSCWLLLAIVTPVSLLAALSGTKAVGPTGDYASLTAALADVQAQTLDGPLVLELQPAYVGTVETFPLVFGAGLTTTATNTLTVRPQAGATALSISSADITAATVDLNGAQFVTIDGRPGGVGSHSGSGGGLASQLTIENTGTTGIALRFINEASNNTLRYINLRSENTNRDTGTVFFSTTTGANGNDNNTVDHCDIGDGASTPATGLHSMGTTTATAQNNSGNSVTSCNIFNFHSTTTTAKGVFIDSGSKDWTLTGNSFYQTVSRTGVPSLVTAIDVAGENTTVTGNFIGGSAPNAGGTPWTATGTSTSTVFCGINLFLVTAPPSNVQGNTIANMLWTTASINGAAGLSGIWNGIFVSRGNVNVGTVTGNTIGGGTGTGSISVTTSGSGGTSIGICVGAQAATGTVAIANNTIGSITTNGSASTISASITGISVTGGAGITISNNTVGSTVTPNSLNAATSSTSTTGQQVTGIFSSGTGGVTISGNTVANLNNNYAGNNNAGQIRGIVTSAGVNTITGNTVRNLSTTSQNAGTTTSASVLGIVATSTTAGQTLSQNTVHSLANTAATAAVSATGIYYSGPTSGTNVIARNFVHSLAVSSSSATSVVNGMQFAAGDFTVQNNLVRVGLDASGTSTASAATVRGIVDGASPDTHNFYHNSVYIGGTQTSGGANSFTLSSSGSGNVHDYRNNIFVNTRSRSGTATGGNYVITYAGTGTNPAGLTSNGNLYFASGVGGVLCRYAGADRTTLAALRTAIGQDASSAVGDPLFVNSTGDAGAVDLHIPANSPANNAGIALGAVTNDFDGQPRSASTPDIGADETAPDIAVAQTGAVADGGSFDFGAVTLGGSSTAKTFTITNPGIADLTGLSITGATSEFTVSALSGTSVPAGGNATFTVTFTPGASGSRTATLQIASNVTGAKNPYDITLTGTGQTLFHVWAVANGVPDDPLVFGANGQRNLINFASGLDPAGNATTLQYEGSLSGGGTILAPGLPVFVVEETAGGSVYHALYTRRKDYALAGLVYTAQFSIALDTWVDGTIEPTVLADDGVYQIVSLNYPLTLTGEQNTRFFRVVVTSVP